MMMNGRRLGVVSSWNVKCGIAEYCAHLVQRLAEQGFQVEVFSNRDATSIKSDEAWVHRDWDNNAQTVPDLVRSIVHRNVDYLLIQYHGAFYPPRVLGSIIDHVSAQGLQVFVVYHATHFEELRSVTGSLTKAVLNLVHSSPDVARLTSYGLTNVRILPHGIHVPNSCYSNEPCTSDDFSIGSFGFLMPHKGFLELMCAAYLLRRHIPDLRLHLYACLYPNVESEKLLTRCCEYIRYLGCSRSIELESRFLEIDEVTERLRRCRLLVFPYQHSNESSSAAVRVGLASGRPVLCTPLEIFGDAAAVLHYCKGFDPFAIAVAILERYRSPELLNQFRDKQESYLKEHTWSNVAHLLACELAAYKPGDPRTAKQATANGTSL